MPNEHRWLAVTAMALSLFLSALSATSVTLALPTIAHQFHLSASLASLVTLSNTIPLTVLILPAGGLVSRFRVLPIFLIAVLGFGLGSLVCGLAASFPLLLVGRAIEGCFGAVLATQALAVAAAVVAPSERGRAMGITTTVAPLGAVVGPAIGGLLLTYSSWPSIFFATLPICGLSALLAIFSLRGVSLSEQSSTSAYRQMGGLLRRPSFLGGLLAIFWSGSALTALYYLLPFDLSNVEHLAPAVEGVIFLCVPLGMSVMGPLGGYLTDRYGSKPFILTGAGLLLLGSLLLTLIIRSPTSELDLVWRLLLIGMGMGLFIGPNQTRLMSIGTRETMGAASALSNLANRLGPVVGPLMMGLTWTFLSGTSAQMGGGMLLIDGLALIYLICAYLAVMKRPSGFSPGQGLERNGKHGEIPLGSTGRESKS